MMNTEKLPDYHQDVTRISKSGLDLIARSPAHYWQAYLAPERERVRKASREMQIGIAFHTLVLEPAKFSSSFALIPKLDLRRKEDRIRAMEFEDQHGGKLLLNQEEVDSLQRMRDSLFRHATAKQLFSGNLLVEHQIEWTDERTGAQCKCRYDCINWEMGLAPDLKTTKDASPKEFSKSVAHYRYHVQDAFYSDGYRATYEGDVPEFLFVAIESEPPYGVAVYQLESEDRAIGRALYERDLDTYMRSLRADSWPAYPETIQSLKLPNWARL